jgi:hypothetical protein
VLCTKDSDESDAVRRNGFNYYYYYYSTIEGRRLLEAGKGE